MSASYQIDLPPELWKYVIELATTKGSGCYDAHITKYLPFLRARGSSNRSRDRLKIAFSLFRVSKQWQEMAAEFLFREIRVGRGAQGLLESLKGSGSLFGGYGRYVRLLEFPSKAINHDEANPIRLFDIMSCCPHLQTLVKRPFSGRHDPKFWSNLIPPGLAQTIDVRLTSLKRIEWSNRGHLDIPSINASGLILANLLLCSPNLCYLSVSWPGPLLQTFISDSIIFPVFQTLRGGHSHTGIEPHHIPRLTHLILEPFVIISDIFVHDSPFASVLNISLSQLRVFEDREESDNFLYFDSPGDIFQYCPNVEEVAFRAGYDQMYYPGATRCPKLKRVNLSISSVNRLRREMELDPDPEHVTPEVFGWRVLDEEFLLLNSLPALEHVVLYGDWSAFAHEARFQPLRQRLLDRGCSLEYSNGTPV